MASTSRFYPWRAVPNASNGLVSGKNPNIPTRLSALSSNPDAGIAVIPVLPTTFTKHKGSGGDVALRESYKVKPQDVLYGAAQQGSGQHSSRHAGNRRLNIHAELRLTRYLGAGQDQKGKIVQEILQAVKDSGGIFVKHDGTAWYQVSDVKAMDMTSSVFRCLSLQRQGASRRRSAPSAVASKTRAAAAIIRRQQRHSLLNPVKAAAEKPEPASLPYFRYRPASHADENREPTPEIAEEPQDFWSVVDSPRESPGLLF